MRKLIHLLVALFLTMTTLGVKAQTMETHSFTTNRAIPDGNVAGLSDVHAVTSAIANLSSLRVKLHIAGEFNGDLYGYVRQIRGGTTNFCALLNRPGRTLAEPAGYSDAGLNLVFQDSGALGDIHNYRTVTNVPPGSPLVGSWQPDGRWVDPAVVLDTTSRTTTLSSFTGAGGGTWTLFLADVESGGTNMLSGWELEFTGSAAPAVTWPMPADIVYGTALGSAQLNATATFGGTNVPGTFTYSPPAGTVLSAGSNQTLSVIFTPANTSSFVSATNNVSIHVLKAPLTITALSTSKVYGQTVTFAGTEFTSSGLVNSDTVASATLASAGAAATATVAGAPYPVVPSAAAGAGLANYTISYTNGTLSVSAKPLTITANNASKVYGQTVTFAGTEFTSSGLVNSDTVASATLTSAGAAATATVAGSPYAIVPSAAAGTGLANYSISYTNGMLSVSVKPLTITANNASKVYGQTVSFAGTEFTSSGLVNSDTVASATLTSAGAAATATVAGSPYAIAPSAAAGTGLANYTINYADGTLSISVAGSTGVVTSSANPSLPGQSVIFTMTLSAVAPASGAPGGTVQFKIDGTNAGGPASLSSGAATCTTTLAHGTHTVAAEYAGDGNFTGTTSSLSPVQLVNSLPVAGGDAIERAPTAGVKVSIATLLTNDFDADGDSITLVSVSTSSTHGGTVVSNGNWILYTPAAGFTNSDTFTYTISDGFGTPVIGTVNVNIRNDQNLAPNLAITVLGNGSYEVRGDGIPGCTYRIEFAEDVQHQEWQTLGPATASPFGVLLIIDSTGSPQRFYRSVHP